MERLTPLIMPRPPFVLASTHPRPGTRYRAYTDRMTRVFFGPGGIMSVNALGQPIVILNSAKIARDLLEKRGALYSDRPLIPMLDL